MFSTNKFGWRMFLLVVLLIVLGSHGVFGLGMLPASHEVLLGKDNNEFSIFILNDGQNAELNISIEGSLSEFIELDKTTLMLSSNNVREEIKVNIKEIPSNVVPGEHVVRIIISQESKSSSQISARISLSFRLTIIVPYDDAFLDVSLFAPNFDETKNGNFIIQTQNKGSTNAVDVVPVIDIYSATNQKVATIRGEAKLIRSGEFVTFALPLKENLQNGRYLAKASLVYSGKSTIDEKTFTIGRPEIIVESISASEFKLGGIANFDIVLTNKWTEDLRVYADIEFMKNNEKLQEFTTATTNIQGSSNSKLQAYWDTSGVPEGIYALLINLNYLDKQESSIHEIRLDSNKISILGTGKVVSEREETDTLPLLIFVVLILVILNSFLIYVFLIKKKKKSK